MALTHNNPNLARKLAKALLAATFLAATLACCCACSKPAEEAQPQPTNQQAQESPSQKETPQATTLLPGVSQTGALSVNGAQLVDSKGNPIQLKGLSTHGLAWFPQYVNEDFFRQMRTDWGCNVVRLALYTAENGGYCTGGNQNELRNLVENGVKYAIENDLYVIIDWHILSDNNPQTNQETAKDFFNEMSQKYANVPNVLYEICNEPNGATTWSDIKQYANEVIPVIRQNAPDAVIIVGTPTWSQRVDQAAADPITGYENIMYTLHFYAATHKEDLRATMQRAHAAGLPLFVTEFGICDASGNGAIDESQANTWVGQLDALGISYLMWNISNKDESSSIISPTCSKTNGFAQDDLSASGAWFLKMMNGQLPKTEAASSSTNAQAEAPQTTGRLLRPYESAENATTVTATATMTNSWESEGQQYRQYDIAVTNNTQQACNTWTAEVDLGYQGTVSDAWCAGMLVQGTKLLISPEDYNSQLAPGQTITGIGAIAVG